MKKLKENNIKDLHKYVSIYYGLNKYAQQLLRASWGLEKKSNYNHNLIFILNLEKFIFENFYSEDFIKNLIIKDINLKKELKNYKGFRLLYKLPLKGQRTKTNRQTSKKFVLPNVSLQDLNYKIKNKLFK